MIPLGDLSGFTHLTRGSTELRVGIKEGQMAGRWWRTRRCRAKTRNGRPCQAPGNGRGGRCKLHGGKSTGTKTKAANWTGSLVDLPVAAPVFAGCTRCRRAQGAQIEA
jgi:hypothetical protein